MFDVTAEKEAEQQAREAELRYRSLVESLPCLVYIDQLDERATNVYTSPQTDAIFGFTQQDWNDDPDLWLGKMVHPEDRERCRLAEAYHTETGELFDETYRILHRDGRILWVRDVAVVVEDADGIPLYSQGFLLDITSQKEAESELEHALEREHAQAEHLRSTDELKNTLLHTLSHDLKDPITAVLAATTALKRPDVRESERQELLDGMAVRARRMDRLLGDLLDLERLGQGVLEPSWSPVDVGELVRDVVAENDLLEGRVVDVDAPRLLALVDPAKVERAIDNLLVNAARHTPAGNADLDPGPPAGRWCARLRRRRRSRHPGRAQGLDLRTLPQGRSRNARFGHRAFPRVWLRRVPWGTSLGAGPAGRRGRVPRLLPGNRRRPARSGRRSSGGGRRTRKGFTGPGRVSEPVVDRRGPVTHAAFRAFDLMCL